MAATKRPPNNRIIRRSFDVAVERAARLATFSLAPPHRFGAEISDRAEKLAHDDLVVFAISARRLFDAAGLVALSQSSKVMELRPQMSEWHLALEHLKNISLRLVLNMIVHSDTLEISTYELHVLALAGHEVPSEIAISQIAQRDFGRVLPIILLRTDREPYRFVRLSELIDGFSDCLDEVVAHCWKMGIDLETSADGDRKSVV